MSKRLTQEEFVLRSNEVHNNKYDYSKTVYVSAHVKVIIICNEHGEFEQTGSRHLRGDGCPRCNKSNKMTGDESLHKAKLVYGNEYTYENTRYIKSTEKVVVTCPMHGDFKVLASSFLAGHACPKCWVENRSKIRTLTTETFVEKAVQVHGLLYDYSSSKYTGRKKPVDLICKKHGKFTQMAGNHLKGAGCPLCAEYGFNHTKDAFLYVHLIFDGNNYFTGYGITNNIENRTSQHTKTLDIHGFKICESFLLRCSGSSAIQIEREIKQHYTPSRNAANIEGFKRESTDESFEAVVVFANNIFKEKQWQHLT